MHARARPLQLGLSSYAYGWAVGVPGARPPQPMTATALLRRTAELGLALVQIADNLPLHELSEGELGELERTSRQLGVRVELGTRGIEAARLRRYLGLAERFGSGVLRLVIDTPQRHPGEDEIVQALRPLLADFEAAGVVLAIENHDRFTAADLDRLFERLDSPAVGLCLDTANSFGAGEGVRAVAEALAPWVVNLHIKDYAVRRLPHLMGFTIEGRPAGGGDLDIPWLLDLVRREAPREVSAILELWPPPERELADTLEKEAEWVEESVAYLKLFFGLQ